MDGFPREARYRLLMNHRRWDRRCCRWGGHCLTSIPIRCPNVIANGCRTRSQIDFLSRIRSLIAKLNR
jgi:hypothetical protein